MPAERPMSKASENRRATKPIMEKRRRARINQCLSELKTLILDALNKDPSRHSKLEKADILEMTVRHLQNIQRQQMAAAISTDSSVLNKFKAGFNECATEVTRYVSRIEGVDPALRQRLLSHLSNCLTTMNNASHFQQQQQQSANLTFGGSFPSMLQSLSVQIPAGLSGIVQSGRSSSGDINNNTSPTAQSGGKVFAGLSVIPSRLPNGDFAFLLPSQSIPGSFHLPSSSVSASSSLPSSSGPDRNSQSSWSPTSPSSKRSASPDAMSEDNVVLSPTCSDAGSDVFIEPYHPTKHQQHMKEMVLSPVPHPMHRTSPHKDRHEMVLSPVPHHLQSHKDRHEMVLSPVPHQMHRTSPHKDRHEMVLSPVPHHQRRSSPHRERHEMVLSPVPHQMHRSSSLKDRHEMVLSPVPHPMHRTSPHKDRHEMVLSPVPHHQRRSSPHRERHEMVLSPVHRSSSNKERHILIMSRHQQVMSESENVWRPW